MLAVVFFVFVVGCWVLSCGLLSFPVIVVTVVPVLRICCVFVVGLRLVMWVCGVFCQGAVGKERVALSSMATHTGIKSIHFAYEPTYLDSSKGIFQDPDPIPIPILLIDL
jgi:hypothetical protein